MKILNRRSFLTALSLASAVPLLAQKLVSEPPSSSSFQPHHHVEILYVDSQSSLIKVDNQTREPVVLAHGGLLDRPYAVTASRHNRLYISDTGRLCVLEYDPRTGELSLFAQGGRLHCPYGLDIGEDDVLYVANSEAIIALNPATYQQELIASGSEVGVPIAVACLPNHQLLVVDARGRIIQIDLRTRQTSVFVEGGALVSPSNLIVAQGKVFVADYSAARIVAVDMATRRQTAFNLPPEVGGPVGIAWESEGQLVLGCPDAYGTLGAIVRLHLKDGSVEPVLVGSGELTNPRGLVVVRGHESTGLNR